MLSTNWRLGISIIESDHLTVQEECTNQRSWRERLLSWPWRPWQATEVIIEQVPDPNVYWVKGRAAIVCHPAIAQCIREAIALDTWGMIQAQAGIELEG